MREWDEPPSAGADVPMPAELRAGPEIGRWADPASGFQQHSALRAWQAAVRAWAVEAGLTGRDLLNAQNRARMWRAYDRQWIIADDRRDLLDYWEGRRDDEPPSTGWRPNVRLGEPAEVEPS